MFSRAFAFAPLKVATRRDVPILRIASRANMSLNGEACRLVKASSACASASIPVDAVTDGGIDTVRSGSRSEQSG